MSFVLDCSMTMAWVFADEATESTNAVRDSLLADVAIVPVLWAIEVGNVLLVASRRGRINESELLQVCQDLLTLPIDVDAESSDRVLHHVLPLANEHQLTVYDAMYLELALRLDLPLATMDRQLTAAGKSNGVVLL